MADRRCRWSSNRTRRRWQAFVIRRGSRHRADHPRRVGCHTTHWRNEWCPAVRCPRCIRGGSRNRAREPIPSSIVRRPIACPACEGRDRGSRSCPSHAAMRPPRFGPVAIPPNPAAGPRPNRKARREGNGRPSARAWCAANKTAMSPCPDERRPTRSQIARLRWWC
jgi:hypothetical protein